MQEAGYKRCTHCGEIKPLDLFPKSKRNRDGRWGMCKVCKAARDKAWREANPERVRELERNRVRDRAAKAKGDKRYAEQHPERLADIQRRHNLNHPQKARARRAITNGVRDGKITKPDRCEDCGGEFEKHRLRATTRTTPSR